MLKELVFTKDFHEFYDGLFIRKKSNKYIILIISWCETIFQLAKYFLVSQELVANVKLFVWLMPFYSVIFLKYNNMGFDNITDKAKTII